MLLEQALFPQLALRAAKSMPKASQKVHLEASMNLAARPAGDQARYFFLQHQGPLPQLSDRTRARQRLCIPQQVT